MLLTYVDLEKSLFYTNDLLKGLMDMMELYIEKINQADDMFHNNNNQAYDHAVLAEKVQSTKEMLQQRMEGAK